MVVPQDDSGALASGTPQALEDALRRNVLGDPAAPASEFANYVRMLDGYLQGLDDDDLAGSNWRFPDPAAQLTPAADMRTQQSGKMP